MALLKKRINDFTLKELMWLFREVDYSLSGENSFDFLKYKYRKSFLSEKFYYNIIKRQHKNMRHHVKQKKSNQIPKVQRPSLGEFKNLE
jgi:hypothetical protein